MNTTETLIIHSGIVMPPDVKRHFKAALSDLYCGPHGTDHWREETDDPSAPPYSFVESCRVVSKWFHDQDWPSYCDEDGYPLAEGDRQNFEDEGCPYYEVNTSDIKRELFGELARYI